MQSVLERVKIDIPDNVTLHREAKQLLGYKATQSSNLDLLLKTMKDLDIRPFTSESVNKYKQQKAGVLGIILGMMCVLGLITAILFGIIAGLLLVFGVQISGEICAWVLVPSISAVAISAVVIPSIVVMTTGIHEWKKHDIASYQLPIPDFALQTAVDLTKRCPFVKFYVEQLEHDPFLIAWLEEPNGGAYHEWYLEVWNEPGYKVQRTT